MPLFEYACGTCDHQFEALVRGGETPACPSCHGTTLQRRQSVFAARSAGSSSEAAAAPRSMGPCGSCGDPRGPGACSMN
jgi:putative FmdB family regulatory protein